MTQPTADAERFDQMLACADSDAHKEPSTGLFLAYIDLLDVEAIYAKAPRGASKSTFFDGYRQAWKDVQPIVNELETRASK